jgi:Cu(I)/Ag(I) efflux system membrane protein CusA/SilA
MIERIIRGSIRNRRFVLLAALCVAAWGVLSLKNTSVDALPDLSDVQVIIRTTYPGQAPQIVENQVTYPLTTTMLSVPGAKTVRGISFFGDSFVYVLFEEGTDLYWARSRVLEYLNQVQSRLPATAKASLGPDATGVGWIFEYALVDRTGQHDLSQLRALQDWFLKYELKALPNIAEVASIGGMVRQYQVVLDPAKLVAYNVTLEKAIAAIQRANQETGGSVLELAESDYIVRASGYLKSLDDFRAIPVGVDASGTPIRIGDVATIQVGPEMRRGVTELNGEGEVAGGVIVMRSGKNARGTIQSVRDKLSELRHSLPPGVEIVPTYDRSQLIDRAVNNLTQKLVEEFMVVAAVCAIFLWHLRSALVAIISLPLGVLTALIIMRYQGVSANIMSLGGVAIAIGAMVDAAVVMIENAHKRLEAWGHDHPGESSSSGRRWEIITEAAVEVGPALFFSLVIITLSFIPVFTLEAQEGRLFGPLALTKTYAMAAAAGLAVTLVPVLMGYWIRGRIPDELSNPLNRGLIALYRPLLDRVLRRPTLTLVVAAIAFASAAWPLSQLGGEFMPPLNEGDVLYMPSALPGLPAAKASELLQITDRLIKSVPEVATVFGKAGRAETATDPAPMEMFETTVQFKPRDQWRAGMTPEKLLDELDRTVRVPGLTNIWVPPIRNRIDMLATGIKSPIGIKVAGSHLDDIDAVARKVEQVAKAVPGVTSAVAERLTGGRYVDVEIDRAAASRYGLNIADVQTVVSSAIGGETIGETVEGLARFSINVRYPREIRDSLEGLRNLPILTGAGAQITLGTVAQLVVRDGPPMLETENARPSGWVYIDSRGRDLASVVSDLKTAMATRIHLKPGMSLTYSGQFEFLQRANARLAIVVPATLLIIFVLLYLIFNRIDEAVLIMATLPFALTGGIWFLYLAGFNLSVATAVGFIALAGVAAEFGVVMLLYLRHGIDAAFDRGSVQTPGQIEVGIRNGAVLRVRPKAMTVSVIIAGLLPIFWGEGAGSEVMSRIAAPMIGGMITAPLLSMFVIPAAYRLLRIRRIASLATQSLNSQPPPARPCSAPAPPP